MSVNITNIILFATLVSAGFFITKALKNSKRAITTKTTYDSSLNSSEPDHSELDKNIYQHMSCLYEKYWPDFLSYAITEQSFSLPLDVKEKLNKEHGQKFSMPVIKWLDEFNFVPIKFDSRIDVGIKNYMSINNMSSHKSGTPTYEYKEAMLELAHKEAKMIISEMLSSKSQ